VSKKYFIFSSFTNSSETNWFILQAELTAAVLSLNYTPFVSIQWILPYYKKGPEEE